MTAPLLIAPATFSFVAAPAHSPDALRPGEALVRVLAGSVCGSDVPFFRGAPVPSYAGGGRPPVGYPLHEIVGELVAVGPGTESPVAAGSRVVGWATRFDGLADFVVTEAASLAPCPDRWTAEEAVMIQPLACVLYAVKRLGDIRGRRCAVLGLGPIGLLFTHVLKDQGAEAVIGVDRVNREDVAAQFGVDDLCWAATEQWAGDATGSDAPHIVVESVGHQVSTLQHALTAVAACGRIFYFGVNDDAVYPLDMGLLLRKNLTLMSGGTLDRRRMLAEAAEYLARYPQLVKLLVTHRFARADAQVAYELAATPAPGRLKVVLSVADGP